MKILFQGDSITDGNRYREPERRHDLNHQIGHSYAFIVSGMLGAEYPDAGLQFVNRGISADTTRGLLRRWREDALDIEPGYFKHTYRSKRLFPFRGRKSY